MSILADRIAAPSRAPSPTAADRKSRLAELHSSLGRRGEPVELPVIGPARIELLGAFDQEEVNASMLRLQRAREVQYDVMTVGDFEIVRARLTLAKAVVDVQTGEPLGSADDWAQVDVDLIGACWNVYGDVRERLDPMGVNSLDENTRASIARAVKKKDPILLRSFGARALSLWLATTDVQLADSPPPKSSPSE